MEKIEPLSPLRIPYYYKGDLRKLTQNTNSKTKSEKTALQILREFIAAEK